jgi:hypothetical protein
LLQPKQIIVYGDKGGTVINYLPFTREFVAQALPEDEKIQESLPNSCQKVIELIQKTV